MQIEQKLQTGVVAILLSLIAIAGPANSQVTGTDDCDESNTVPLPPDFTTCLDDADVDPTGTPCLDPEAPGCPADPSCADPDPTACVPEGGEPCGEGEVGVTDPVCASDPSACAGETPPFVDGCIPSQTPCEEGEIGLFAPACAPDPALQETLDDLVCSTLIGDEYVDVVDNDSQTCIADAAAGTQSTVVATVAEGLALLAPAVAVAAAEGVLAGDDLVVTITATNPLPLTLVGDILVTGPTGAEPPVALTFDDEGNADFTVAAADAGDYLFEVTAGYEEDVTGLLVGSGSDGATVSAPPLDLVFTLDSLANQLVANTVLVTGTVTSNIDTSNALIAIELTDADAAGSGAQNIVWADGEVDTLDLGATSPESFEALVQWNTQEPVTWTITVTSDDGSASQEFTVTFAGEATYIDFSAGNPPASLVLGELSDADYEPSNAATQNLGVTLTVTDNNGAGTGDDNNAGKIVNDNVGAVLALGEDVASVLVTPGAEHTQPGDAIDFLARDFALGVNLPARLKDGTYTLTASYTNPLAEGEVGPADLTADVSRSVAVGNVPPVIGIGLPGNFPGTERVPGLGVVSFTVDDYNAGTLEGTPVVELASLNVVVRSADGGSCTGAVVTQGLTLSFPLNGGAAVTDGALDFSAVAFNQPIDVSVQVAWSSTAVAGLYEICGTLSDDAASHADVLLGDLGLVALNGGLHLTINDGGDGLATPKVDPGQSTQTEALGIAFTGTQGAESLSLTVGTFQRSSGGFTFTASSVTGKLCSSSSCAAEEVLATASAVAGVVTFPDLSELTGAGVQVFAVLEFTVPLGSAAGNYAAPITVGVAPIVVEPTPP